MRRSLPDQFLVGCIVAERADVRNPADIPSFRGDVQRRTRNLEIPDVQLHI